MKSQLSLEFKNFLHDNNLNFHEEGSLIFIDRANCYIRLVPFNQYGNEPLYNIDKPHVIVLHEDRWIAKGDIVRSIILGKAGVNKVVFARDCCVEKISVSNAIEFHNKNHLIGSARTRYNYALITRKEREVVAVSSFSTPRLMARGELLLRSHEWVRHTTTVGVRIIGGMSKALSFFIKERDPEEIMTYCDMDWSDGSSYCKMGFSISEEIRGIDYYIDKVTCERRSKKQIGREYIDNSPHNVYEKFQLLRAQGNYKLLMRL